MTDLRAAAQQALDYWESASFGDAVMVDKMDALRAALAEHDKKIVWVEERKAHWAEQLQLARETQERERQQREESALAEPVQEPVAYIHRQGNHFEVSERHLDEDEKARGWTEEPLYTAPPQRPAEPVQEPVAWSFEARHIDSAWAAAVTLKHPGPEGKYMRKVTPLYTAPPQRNPLTEEEILSLFRTSGSPTAFARAIERAHGIT